MKIIKILLIIILVLFFFHLKQYLKINYNIEILQLNSTKLNIWNENFYNKLPIILTNSMNNWGYFTEWTIDLIHNKYKNKFISTFYNDNNTLIKKKGKISDFIDKLNNASNIYGLTNYFDDIDIQNDIISQLKKLVCNNNIDIKTKFCIGNKNSVFNIQSDSSHNLILCQLYGTCKVLLWNPSEREKLYPSNKFDKYTLFSKVDINNIKEEFIEFNKSKYIEIILNPGQILHIPNYWWYNVQNLNRNITLYVRSESYFTYFVKLFCEKYRSFIHNLNLYQNDNCICCTE